MCFALTTFDPVRIREVLAENNKRVYDIANAHGYLCKEGASPRSTPSLVGKLYLAKSGWLLLSVPNAIVHGLFDALHEPGAELPLQDGALNSHISVMSPDEIEQIGGPDKISERGHMFNWQLGPIKTVEPTNWNDVGRVWYATADSIALRNLRKSYGLEPLRKGYDHHVTIAIRRKGVLQNNDIKKAAGENGRPRHLIILGASGAGKSTLAKKLAKKLDMPQRRMDWDHSWKDNKSLLTHTTCYVKGSKANHRFKKLCKKVARRALAEKRPSVLDGIQPLFDPDLLRGHRVVVLDAPEDLVVKQRVGRDKERGKLAEDGSNLALREEKARYLYRELKPLIEEVKKRPGVEVLKPEEIDGWLAKQKDHDGEQPERRPSVGVDLDGTIFKNRIGEKYDHKKFGEPRQDYVDIVKKLRAAGCVICIWTVRDNKEDIEDALEEHDIPWDWINENPDHPNDSDSPKRFFDVILDDRGVNATQSAVKALKEIKELLEAGDPPPAFDMSSLSIPGEKHGCDTSTTGPAHSGAAGHGREGPGSGLAGLRARLRSLVDNRPPRLARGLDAEQQTHSDAGQRKHGAAAQEHPARQPHLLKRAMQECCPHCERPWGPGQRPTQLGQRCPYCYKTVVVGKTAAHEPKHHHRDKADDDGDTRPYRQRVGIYPMRRGSIMGGFLPSGSWSGFGGGVEEGETPAQAVAREMLEETGYPLTNIRPAGLESLRRDWEPYEHWVSPERRKQYRGDETHFFLGDVAGPMGQATEPSTFKNIGFRRPATILRLLAQIKDDTNPFNERHRILLPQLNKTASILDGLYEPIDFEKAAVLEAMAPAIKQLSAAGPVRNWFGSHGMYMPLSGYTSGNPYLDQQEFAERGEHWDAMANAATADKSTYRSFLRGIANMTGMKSTGSLNQAIDRAAGDITKISPYMMTYAPELWDRLHGDKGTAASLASSIYKANRGQKDPVTGKWGYSPETSAHIAQKVFEQLYGPNAKPNATHGYSARDMGLLYEQMRRLGLLSDVAGSGSTTGSTADRLSTTSGAMTNIRRMTSMLGKQGSAEGGNPMWALLDDLILAHINRLRERAGNAAQGGTPDPMKPPELIPKITTGMPKEAFDLQKLVEQVDDPTAKGSLAGTAHKRLAVAKKLLSPEQIQAAGFEPSLMAIPEQGQDQWTSFRHPKSNLHIHSHPDYWTIHNDRHPSVMMAMRHSKGVPDTLKALSSGMKHFFTEGVPGAGYYARNRISNLLSKLAPVDTDPMVSAIRSERPDAVIDSGLFQRLLAKVRTWGREVPVEKQGADGVRVGYRFQGETRVPVCPRCDRDLIGKNLYRDAKNWTFCRWCFSNGKGGRVQMDKQASFAAVTLLPRLLYSGVTKLLRGAASPFRNYYANMSRAGMESGFNPAQPTILPRARWLAQSAIGPTSGVTDYEVGRAIGGGLRTGKMNVVKRLLPTIAGVVEPLGFNQTVSAIAHNRPQVRPAAPGEVATPSGFAVDAPISRIQRRRLRKAVPAPVRSLVAAAGSLGAAAAAGLPATTTLANLPSTIKTMATTGNLPPAVRSMATAAGLPATGPVAPQVSSVLKQVRSPVVRHALDALQGPPPSPVVDFMKRRLSSTARPALQGPAATAVSSGLGAVRGLAFGGPPLVGALESGVETGVLEAPMLALAQRNRLNFLKSMKARLVSSGIAEAEGTASLRQKIQNRALGWFDPTLGEFINSGHDLAMLQRHASRVPAIPGVPNVNEPMNRLIDFVKHEGSLPKLQMLRQDLAPKTASDKALGIPSRKDYGDLAGLEPRQIVTFLKATA